MRVRSPNLFVLNTFIQDKTVYVSKSHFQSKSKNEIGKDADNETRFPVCPIAGAREAKTEVLPLSFSPANRQIGKTDFILSVCVFTDTHTHIHTHTYIHTHTHTHTHTYTHTNTHIHIHLSLIHI